MLTPLTNKLLVCDTYLKIDTLLDTDTTLELNYLKEFLPNNLKSGIDIFQAESEQWVAIYAIITAFGSLMIDVTGKYSNRTVYAMLYLAIIGPAGSNKSVINTSREVLKKLHKIFRDQSDYYMKNYISEKSKWNRLVKSDPNLIEPEKPPYAVVNIAADITKAKFLEQLRDNKNIPSAIISDEIDTLIASINSDHGNGLSSVLRTIYHHDEVSQQLKSDNQHIEIECPKLVLILGGTEDQMKSLIGSIVNGMYSRFLILTLEGDLKWKDASPSENGNERSKVLNELSNAAVVLFDYLGTNSFEMLLTKKQWSILNEFGDENLGILSNLHNEHTASVVKRHGLMAFRIAMILTGIRYWENKLTNKQVYCIDEDFVTALILMRKSFKNSISFFGQLKDGKKTPLASKNESFLKSLSDSFTRAEAVEVGKKMKFSIRTTDQILKNLTDGKQIAKISFGNYEKTSLANLQIAD